MSLWQWSPTAANNATAATNINWQEGQAPSTVNDSARQMMADVASYYQNGPEWLNYGDALTYISGTQFTVPGNLTARYSVGRRVRASVTAGTVYGTITASAYTSLTTVTLTTDSGSLDSGLSEVDVGILNPAAPSLNSLPGLTLNEPGNGTQTLFINGANDSNGACLRMTGQGANPSKYIRVGAGFLYIFNSANSAYVMSVDDSGNLTAAGNVTANSDERLKSDWESLPENFLDQLAAVHAGTFTRISTGERNAGVSAQSLQTVLPETVLEGPDGLLSVAYGNAALVACVELAKEVVFLRGRLARFLDGLGETL